MEKAKVAVVVVPLTAQGHLNQLLHFAHLVSSSHDTIPVHFVSTETHVRQATTRVHGWNPSSISNVHFHGFEMPRGSNPEPDPHSKVKFPSQLIPSMKASITHLREPVCSLLQKLSPSCERLVVVYDSSMAYTVQDVPTVSNAEAYCFHSISAFSLFSFCWEIAGKPNSLLSPDAEVVKEVPSMEGCFVPEFEQISSLIRGAPKVNYGDIYNTSRAIEGLYLDLLAKHKVTGTDIIWAIGPFHPLSLPPRKEEESEKRSPCLEWLDEQEPGSVIFVSFGSTTSLSDQEINQLAQGLERSGQKFIWVLRDADRGNVFDGEARGRDLLLPQGYEERIEGRGLIVRGWAPQLEILGHASTGGFLSHCGWNSCIESISMGVPMATWPMHSDQPRNSVLVTKLLKTGLALKDWNRWDEDVSSAKIEEVVRRLMASNDGNELRRRAKELARAVKNCFKESSEMDSFIQHICR